MGGVCSCNDDSHDGDRMHKFSESELALIIKIQSAIRRKIAMNQARHRRMLSNKNFFCKFLFFAPNYYNLYFNVVATDSIEVQGKIFPSFSVPQDRLIMLH